MHDEIPASYRLVCVEFCSKEMDPVLSIFQQASFEDEFGFFIFDHFG